MALASHSWTSLLRPPGLILHHVLNGASPFPSIRLKHKLSSQGQPGTQFPVKAHGGNHSRMGFMGMSPVAQRKPSFWSGVRDGARELWKLRKSDYLFWLRLEKGTWEATVRKCWTQKAKEVFTFRYVLFFSCWKEEKHVGSPLTYFFNGSTQVSYLLHTSHNKMIPFLYAASVF